MTLQFEILGYHWPHGGDYAYLDREEDGEHQTVRIFVDDLGETWADVRRVPEGGSFATERVYAQRFRVLTLPQTVRAFQGRGYGNLRYAPQYHRVTQPL